MEIVALSMAAMGFFLDRWRSLAWTRSRLKTNG